MKATLHRDKRIDAYIAKSATFAQPILKHLRGIVHSACPDVEETMKWGFPHFTYKGLLCSMAAFKEHCSFGFWKASLIIPAKQRSAEGMGSFGRLTAIKDLPSKAQLVRYVKAAMQLNDDGVKSPTHIKRTPRKPLTVPDDLAAALKRSRRARTTFESFSPSNQRDYIEWLTEAKGDDTRKRRLATTIEWLAEGKPRNWKFAASK